MATVTATPADVTMTFNRFSSSVSGTVSWTAPTVPSGAIITSVTLTGTVTASNSNVTSIKLNDQTLTTSTSGAAFTINLGTDNSKTSLSASASKSGWTAYTVKFSDMVYTVEYQEETYTVIFKDEDGNILKTAENVSKNYSVRYISPSISKDGYKFIGWMLESAPNGYTVDYVTANMTLIPKFEKNPVVNITQNEGGYFTYNDVNYAGDQSFQLEYNDTFEIVIAVNEGYGIAYYTFKYGDAVDLFKHVIAGRSIFNLSLDMKSDYDVAIKYVKLDSKFTVTFEDYDGSVIKTVNDVAFGASVSNIKPDNPTRNGYKFSSWTGADISDPIVDDTVFTAQYTEALTITIIQNKGGYFMYKGKKYEGYTVLDFTDVGMIDADLDFYCNDGYYFAYTHQIDLGDNWGFDEEENGTNSSFSQGWQSITDNQVFKVEYARLSSINKENVTINGKRIIEVYLGNKPIRIYKGDDRII